MLPVFQKDDTSVEVYLGSILDHDTVKVAEAEGRENYARIVDNAIQLYHVIECVASKKITIAIVQAISFSDLYRLVLPHERLNT